MGCPRIAAALTLAGLTIVDAAPAASQSISRVYTQFDSDKCRHTRGKAVEDYGSWRCRGYRGTDIYLSAGDQRMTVSFGPNAARERAARETFPGFNSMYRGTVEWRIETPSQGDPRAFATILRWNVKLEHDERDTTGRILVITRLGLGGVCHVGYVDARANTDANELAAKLADERARSFKCGSDKPVVAGKVRLGLHMPTRD